jgi:hypothetical protein
VPTQAEAGKTTMPPELGTVTEEAELLKTFTGTFVILVPFT